MSRVLKFRIWDKANKEYMILGAMGLDAMNGDVIDYYNEARRLGGSEEYDVEQYTGLTDKNGKEICEGDIVKITRELTKTRIVVYIYQIKYDNSRAAFTCWKNNHFACMFFENSEGNCEVIGNIHENSELLGGEE